jgi:P4 family phage/plasmid primase-like protien
VVSVNDTLSTSLGFGNINRAFRKEYLPRILEAADAREVSFHKCVRCETTIEEPLFLGQTKEPVRCYASQGGCDRAADETKFEFLSKWARPEAIAAAIEKVALEEGFDVEYLKTLAVRSFALSGEIAVPEGTMVDPLDIEDHAAVVDYLTDEYRFATMMDTGEVFVYRDGVYRAGAEAVIARAIETMFQDEGESAKHHFVNEVTHAIRRRTYKERAEFNPAGKVCLLNGILNLDGELSVTPHSPDIFFTAQIPVAYDSSATCPRFEKFLEDVLPDLEARKTVQMMAGSIFEPGQKRQLAFMLYGAGCNGKSTLLGVLKDLLGPENVSTESLQTLAESHFAAADLWGKLANICDDIPAKAIRQTSAFKMATGGSLMRGERKFQHPFSFVNTAKLLFSCNVLPQVDDPTNAFWRRWKVLEFPVSFIGREDRDLPDLLRDELDGILNWAIAGAKMLHREGDFPSSASVDAIREQWQNEADSLRWFVKECVVKDKDGWLSKEEFFEAYTTFADDRDVPVKSREQVGRQLPDFAPSVRSMKRRIGGDAVRGWAGILLRASPASPDSDDGRTVLPGTGGTSEAGTSVSCETRNGPPGVQ